MAKFDYRKPAIERAAGGSWWADRPQMPYILPFFAYVLLMAPAALGTLGVDWERLWKDYLPAVYAAKTVLAAILLWIFWPCYARIQWRRLGLGAAVGIGGAILWIAAEYGCQYLGIANPKDPAAHLFLFNLLSHHATSAQVVDVYNPDVMLARGLPLLAFLCVRVAGPSLVVPVMEELFFRDFLMRVFVGGARFDEVPVGAFTWPALLGMAALFGINHGTTFFFPGMIYGLLMGILLIRTKSLGACMVAHGVTNWTLYLYVIYTGDWQFM